MTMVSSGPISLAGNATTGGLNQSINIELGQSATATISLNDSNVRTLLAVPSGAISLNDAYGKSNRVAITYTYSANATNASLNVSSIGGYVAGTSDVTITVNSGVYLSATSTGNYGLALTGGTTGDTVTLVNNGYIMGQGGNGGSGAGGPALNVNIGITSITVNNTNGSAYIGGGGGGGRQQSGDGGSGGGSAAAATVEIGRAHV